ncbi:FkbM family methyltransferase [Paenibacillus sp. Y412MC10]|uniref:FkbM family methyltransferase n=1 Tax=Geobacillus sp. (strain Y412MC10) TaxID=481743 RepID=UPI0011AB83CC|nr:FkbM family methyltransferase [Paenibacillus sp. Y412MC10]
MKLDVQGYELEVLKGAEQTLKDVELVLLEASVRPYNEDAPLFYDVINYMKKNGFIVFDICSLMRKPNSNILLQVDLLFVNENSELCRIASQPVLWMESAGVVTTRLAPDTSN